MSRAFSTYHPDRDLPAASEAVSLLIEMDLQGLSLRVIIGKVTSQWPQVFTLLRDKT